MAGIMTGCRQSPSKRSPSISGAEMTFFSSSLLKEDLKSGKRVLRLKMSVPFLTNMSTRLLAGISLAMARAKIPPIEVPAMRSKWRAIGPPSSRSISAKIVAV
ncbi:hypothetical protein D3C78_1524410 [compost metagenome]